MCGKSLKQDQIFTGQQRSRGCDGCLGRAPGTESGLATYQDRRVPVGFHLRVGSACCKAKTHHCTRRPRQLGQSGYARTGWDGNSCSCTSQIRVRPLTYYAIPCYSGSMIADGDHWDMNDCEVAQGLLVETVVQLGHQNRSSLNKFGGLKLEQIRPSRRAFASGAYRKSMPCPMLTLMSPSTDWICRC